MIEQKYGVPTANSLIALLNELPNVIAITAYYNWRLMTADEDDNKYCDCAVAANSDYIVTEDRHFDALKRLAFPPINVLSIDDFAEIV